LFLIVQIMLFVFWACSACLLLYWMWFALALIRLRHSGSTPPTEWPGVSVIICFKNEQIHLRETLTAILTQDYPKFEVVAMDDYSEDHSKDIVIEMQDQRIRYLHAKRNAPGKKAALSEAIRNAKYPLCLLTDADCRPASNRWIRSMVRSYLERPGTEIVLGIAPTSQQPGILNMFQRYETTLTAIQYISYARAGIPYMGVGRNLLYLRKLFLDKGFASDATSVISGDDDLFVQFAANKKNTAINTDPEAFVYSPGKADLFSFLRQKSRHVSTSVYYSHLHKILLGMFSFIQLAWFIFLVLLIMSDILTGFQALIILVLKWLVQMTLFIPASRVLKTRKMLVFFPLLDLCMMAYYIVMPWTLFKTRKQW
jgi:glycosyltransferase involved in cell wall biosynthesis